MPGHAGTSPLEPPSTAVGRSGLRVGLCDPGSLRLSGSTARVALLLPLQLAGPPGVSPGDAAAQTPRHGILLNNDNHLSFHHFGHLRTLSTSLLTRS
jgi:hypothetical protein